MGAPGRGASPVCAARDAIVVLSTAPDAATGERIARILVDARLAACVNVVPGVISVYRWKGELSRDQEVLCVIKTRRSLLARLAARLREAHPYEVPEILALGIESGAIPYLRWMRSETGVERVKKSPAGHTRKPLKEKGKRR